MNISLIPYGKENKISKKSLMKKANITEKVFCIELAKLREQYIIMSDSISKSYWRPNSKEEYEDFIRKYQHRNYNTNRMIMLAYKEMQNIAN